MIEQKSVTVGDKTAPATIHDIRERITHAIDATEGSAFERLKIWLQMPTDSEFKLMLDADCLVRVGVVGARLSTGGQEPYTYVDVNKAFPKITRV